ncbi:hypothetical protein ACGFIK_27195 [Micromonospora sp. NPDC048871]|uniref:hypothetical protein n=1 Tax=Micromonospora sp. NPDC048871 TaxID=3364259 RepID=UPI0037136A22
MMTFWSRSTCASWLPGCTGWSIVLWDAALTWPPMIVGMVVAAAAHLWLGRAAHTWLLAARRLATR